MSRRCLISHPSPSWNNPMVSRPGTHSHARPSPKGRTILGERSTHASGTHLLGPGWRTVYCSVPGSCYPNVVPTRRVPGQRRIRDIPSHQNHQECFALCAHRRILLVFFFRGVELVQDFLEDGFLFFWLGFFDVRDFLPRGKNARAE